MSSDGLFWAISLGTQDRGFLEKWAPAIDYKALPKGPSQFIVAIMLDHWNETGRLLDEATLLAYLREDADPEENQEIQEVYHDIRLGYRITVDSQPAAERVAGEWVQAHALGAALDSARTHLVTGDREAAFSTLLQLRLATGTILEPPLTLDGGNLGEALSHRPSEVSACPTGLEEIDHKWAGGVYPGELALVMAPTNVGKSMFLCWVAAAAYKANKRVLYFTFELTKLQVLERILTALVGQPLSKIEAPDVSLMALRQGLELDRASLIVDDGIRTVRELEERIKEESVDLVLLDSADDLNDEGQAMWEVQANIHRKLRIDVCQGLGVAVWSSVQATREAVDKARMSLRHVGESYAKAKRANLILGLTQTEADQNNPGHPLVGITVLKDTSHGSKSPKKTRYAQTFGRGGNGYPGYILHNEESGI